MKKLKKIILSGVAVTMLASFALFAVSCDDGDVPPVVPAGCTEHVDANKNGECDNCGADVIVPCEEHYDNDEDNICDNEDCLATIKQAITYTVTVKDADENPVSGVKIKLIKEYKNGSRKTVVEETTDADGKIGGNILPDSYIVEASELPRGWYLTENQTKIEISEASNAHILNAVDNNPAGTEADPHFLGDENFVESFVAGETLYFFVKGAIYVEISTPGASLTYKGETYTTESGKISVLLDAPASENDRTVFYVTNTQDGENVITLVPVAIPGSTGNPFGFEIGESVSAVVDRDGTVYYEWTATEDGTLTLSCATAKNNIFMTNLTNSKTTGFTDGNASDLEPDVIDISLSKGDTVRVAVSYSFGTNNPDTEEDDSAEVVFIASFEET